jgi:hypothetical protein
MVKIEGHWPTDIKKWRVVRRLDISDHRGEKDSFQTQARIGVGFMGIWQDLGPSTETIEDAIDWIKSQCRDRTAPKEEVVWSW